MMIVLISNAPSVYRQNLPVDVSVSNSRQLPVNPYDHGVSPSVKMESSLCIVELQDQ